MYKNCVFHNYITLGCVVNTFHSGMCMTFEIIKDIPVMNVFYNAPFSEGTPLVTRTIT